MLLQSMLGSIPGKDADVPLAIFTFQGRRRFILKSASYKEMMRIVRKAFCLAESMSISLSTSEFDVCEGAEVEIDESAYPFMISFLDMANVVITGGIDKDGSPLTPPTTPPVFTNDRASSLSPDETFVTVKAPYSEDVFKEDDDMDGSNESDEDKNVEEAEHHEGKIRQSQDKPSGHRKESTHRDQHFNAITVRTPRRSAVHPRQEHVGASPPIPQKASFSQKMQPTIAMTTAASQEPEIHPDGPRFRIVIAIPDEGDATFVTRGNYLAKKVLAKACSSFQLPYTHARLFLKVEDTDANGDVDDYMVECVRNKTMHENGVFEDAKLAIAIADSPIKYV